MTSSVGLTECFSNGEIIQINIRLSHEHGKQSPKQNDVLSSYSYYPVETKWMSCPIRFENGTQLIFLRHKHLSFSWLIYVIIYAASESGKQLAGSEFCCWNTPRSDRSRQRRHENGVVTIFVIKEEYRKIHLNRICFKNRYGAATH